MPCLDLSLDFFAESSLILRVFTPTIQRLNSYVALSVALDCLEACGLFAAPGNQ